MKLDYRLEKLVVEHAKRSGLTKGQALEIVQHYFSNIREQIAKGTFEEGFIEIYWPKVGEFRPNYAKIKKLHEVIKTGKQQSL